MSFFKKKGPFLLKDISELINVANINNKNKNFKISGINDLQNAKKSEITFLNSSKYKNFSNKTKAYACITSHSLKQYLPRKCIKLEVDNVLFAITLVAKKFFPLSDVDHPDLSLKNSNLLKKKYKGVFFGQNVLIGKNVKIGKNSSIGSNSIIESNVNIGKNCIIGSFVIVKNTIIDDEVVIQDGSNIGIKGFGFIPSKTKNIKMPHIGRVVLKKGVEIGSECTIDRGSMSDTIIGENTFLDNQVHVAHNVQIGKNCMIAGQVGFAGSAKLADNVTIGGQAGVSGHLNIGKNVSIGGGSGVIKDIPDNTKVMGYPAVELKKFVKNLKNNE